jgi:hypothetical protein
MKKIIVIALIVSNLLGCASNLQSQPNGAAIPSSSSPKENKSAWTIYDPDSNHLWNRVFRQLYGRTTADGKEYGSDELDPLLWFDTTYLLTGDSHQEAIQVLDEFLSTHAENLIQDSLKRAMFQRDMWAVFDWLSSQAEPIPSERRELERLLAQIIKRVALSKEEILALPDNYELAVESKIYPVDVQADHPEGEFLPADLFQPDSAWVPMGREGGPVAMTHTNSAPFFGRSVFLVFVRSPKGREETLDFIHALNKDPSHASTLNLDIALVRRMLLIDDQDEVLLSPLTETIQLRHFSPIQNFHEFELDRARLFDGYAGGLVVKTESFMLFMSHGDVFEIPGIPELRVKIPQVCRTCHLENPPLPNPRNTESIISYSRSRFPLPDSERSILLVTTWADEAQTVMQWKLEHETWLTLEKLWDQVNP